MRDFMIRKSFQLVLITMAPELKEAGKLKAAVAFEFIKDNDHEPEVFYNKILELVGEARDCNAEGSPMMIRHLDGCFLLGFIEGCVNKKELILTILSCFLGLASLTTLYNDLILLENQLPFLVIHGLMSIRHLEDEREKMIHSFLHSTYAHRPVNKKQEPQDEGRQPLHLLELLQEKYLSHHKADDGRNKGKHSSSTLSKASDHSFGSAIELKAKRIYFKSSGPSCLTDINFTFCCYGQLMLPHIVSSSNIKCLFLNMITYEMAPNTLTCLEVCNYIYFMNLLISGANDVIELRSHYIIVKQCQKLSQAAIRAGLGKGSFNQGETMIVILPATVSKVEVYVPRTTKNRQGHQDKQPLHLLGLVREKHLPRNKEDGKDRNAPNKVLLHSFVSATKLKAKEIHFKSSNTFCLTDISFTSSFGHGQWTLPPMYLTCTSSPSF
ncbi:unnamed protein product [Ilex paraguariensis]|uniref:Uncharacterized protein n=1 Tax=Ilex paraguariensis TaxID=185542 RepID=A0ABC8V2A4_9AQUA